MIEEISYVAREHPFLFYYGAFTMIVPTILLGVANYSFWNYRQRKRKESNNGLEEKVERGKSE